QVCPPNTVPPTAFTPRKLTVFIVLPPSPTGCSSLNSVNGRSTLRITCQTPLVSRSHKVIALRSASSKKSEGTALEPLRNGAAPMIRELPAAPLIWSLTTKAQVLPVTLVLDALVLVTLFVSESDLRTTARKKLF